MTFSILARDPHNGRFGVAVATCHLAVGSTVPHIRAGVGAVATQAHTNPYLGICGLERLEQHQSASVVLSGLLADDPQAELRQVQLIDGSGHTAGWTGDACGAWAGHRCRDNVAVAGNLLVGEEVLLAMEAAFLASDPSWKLGRRLLQALRAGEDAGGDGGGGRGTNIVNKNLQNLQAPKQNQKKRNIPIETQTSINRLLSSSNNLVSKRQPKVCICFGVMMTGVEKKSESATPTKDTNYYCIKAKQHMPKKIAIPSTSS